MYRYKITLKHHIQNSWTIWIYIIGLSLLPLYMRDRFGEEDRMMYYAISFGLLTTVLLPQIIVHLNYYLVNKGDTFVYEPSKRSISIEHRGFTETFNFEDIDRIERYMSYPFSENRMQYFPWDGYNHSYVYLKNGNSYVITSLLVPNIDLPINRNKVKIKRNFYRIARKPK